MQVALTMPSMATSTASTRFTSLLAGVLMSAIVMTSIPGLQYTTWDSRGVQPTAAEQAQPEPIPVPQKQDGLDQATLTSYLATNWKLERPYASQVASGMLTSSKRNGIDLMLLMAVAATESSFNHSVGNPGGGNDPRKPYGIMQVAGEFHPEKFPEKSVRRTTVKENIEIGAQVLKEYLASEGGNERRALLRYNGSLNISDKYFQKVRRLKQSLRRGLLAMKSSVSDADRG
ncbi:lytic transglycosylase domain-containing protein [Burkholderia multivorans]|jgi:soluble lytic murein transglycosylase-like protein|uniref:transglycosylase SLT domain-containing protein n=1 Tax=Burkholderia multivorans TaxID=87883 RepID=UPI001C21CDC9|nr:transglycosylase SLT domain-containing protein [Burkholderia multivorans]MBU9200112.1 lytic transglycosylase domain-containing protein [Burkholderia multivorans]MDN8078766.1 transglycosylase SLT domain-containing protein [Burkholderia multivorans]